MITAAEALEETAKAMAQQLDYIFKFIDQDIKMAIKAQKRTCTSCIKKDVSDHVLEEGISKLKELGYRVEVHKSTKLQDPKQLTIKW